MKDFDAEWSERDSEENRTFTLRGETFTRKVAVRPEFWMGYDKRLQDSTTEEQILAVLDGQILESLEGDGPDRYRALRAAENTQVGLPEIQEVIAWLNEEMAQRPTKAPGSSGNGRVRNGEASTARSASAAAEG
jgi:hypothetical protein